MVGGVFAETAVEAEARPGFIGCAKGLGSFSEPWASIKGLEPGCDVITLGCLLWVRNLVF